MLHRQLIALWRLCRSVSVLCRPCALAAPADFCREVSVRGFALPPAASPSVKGCQFKRGATGGHPGTWSPLRCMAGCHSGRVAQELRVGRSVCPPAPCCWTPRPQRQKVGLQYLACCPATDLPCVCHPHPVLHVADNVVLLVVPRWRKLLGSWPGDGAWADNASASGLGARCWRRFRLERRPAASCNIQAGKMTARKSYGNNQPHPPGGPAVPGTRRSCAANCRMRTRRPSQPFW